MSQRRGQLIAGSRTLGIDLDALPMRDRAAMRLLVRADAATASQLARLIYRRERTAQDRLLALWRAGALERSTDPRSGRGTAAYAYRTSQATRTRLGIREPRASSLYLRHTLDIVETVCAMAVPDDHDAPHRVQAWLTERMSADLPGRGIRPDSVIALQAGGRSAVLCIEMDEGTQHAPVIRARLAAYGRTLPARVGWHLLFVIQSEQRVRWLRRLGSWHGPASLEGRSWVVRLADLRSEGLDAPAVPIVGAEAIVPLRGLAQDPAPRESAAPVGSRAWTELLGSGGGEDLSRSLR
jgi:Replication-relaxation